MVSTHLDSHPEKSLSFSSDVLLTLVLDLITRSFQIGDGCIGCQESPVTDFECLCVYVSVSGKT